MDLPSGPRLFPFMRLPAELRICVYGHLFPDKEVPAYPIGLQHRNMRQDGQSCFTAILRTNRAVYKEASDVLYHAIPFVVEISCVGVRYCFGSYLKDFDLTARKHVLFEKVRHLCIRFEVPARGECVFPNLEPSHYQVEEMLEPYRIRSHLHSFVKLIGNGKTLHTLTLIPERDEESEKPASFRDLIWLLEKSLQPIRGLKEVKFNVDTDWKGRETEWVIFKRALESLMMGNDPIPEKNHKFDRISTLVLLVQKMSEEENPDDSYMPVTYKSLYLALTAYEERHISEYLWHQSLIIKTWRAELTRRRLEEQKIETLLDTLSVAISSSEIREPKEVWKTLALSKQEGLKVEEEEDRDEGEVGKGEAEEEVNSWIN